MAAIQNVSTTLPTDYAAEQTAIERRRRLAEALQQQGMQPLETNQTAGGYVVPVSPFQGLAKALQSGMAGYGMRKADEETKALAARAQGDRTADMSTLISALSGKPGQEERWTGEVGTEDERYNPAVPAVPGGRIDPSMLSQLKTPDMQSAALGLYMQQMKPKDPIKMGKDDRLVSPDTFKPLVEALPAPPKYHNVAGNLVPEPTAPGVQVTPVYTAPDKPVKTPADDLKAALVAAGMDPESPEGKALFKSLATKQATHQPPTQITNNLSTEKKYGEAFAGKIADADVSMRDSAIKAPDLADRANRVKQVLASGNVITGTGADIRLSIGKALNLVGANDGETVANTEQLATSMAQNTLDAIKASGLGAGNGFSNADRDFLEKAVGGKITLQADTINRLADLAHRAAAKSAEKWSTRVREIPETALSGTGIKRDPISVPPLYKPGGKAPGGVSPQIESILEKYRGRNQQTP